MSKIDWTSWMMAVGLVSVWLGSYEIWGRGHADLALGATLIFLGISKYVLYDR